MTGFRKFDPLRRAHEAVDNATNAGNNPEGNVENSQEYTQQRGHRPVTDNHQSESTQQPPPTTTPSSSGPVTPSKNLKIVPRNFYDCPMNDLVRLVSSMLEELVALNDALPFKTDQLTRFHSRSAPGISIQDYLIRVIKFCTLEKSIVLSIIYFIDLLCTTYIKFNINSLTVHRFIITAAMVGSKGLCDSFCTNSHYARVGGVSKVELNLLEVEFLTRVDYRIVPKAELLNQYYESMVGRLEGIYMFSEPSLATDLLLSPPSAGLTPPSTNQNNYETSSAPSGTNDLSTSCVNARYRAASHPAESETPTPPNHVSSEPVTSTTTPHRSVKVTLREAALSLSKLMLPSDIARREGRKNRTSVLKRRFSSSNYQESSSAPAIVSSDEHEHEHDLTRIDENSIDITDVNPESLPNDPPPPPANDTEGSPHKRASVYQQPPEAAEASEESNIQHPMTPKRPKPTP